jgi:hypothetical protein
MTVERLAGDVVYFHHREFLARLPERIVRQQQLRMAEDAQGAANVEDLLILKIIFFTLKGCICYDELYLFPRRYDDRTVCYLDHFSRNAGEGYGKEFDS